MPGDALTHPRHRRHAGFSTVYLHLGLLAALSAGFGVASYLASHLGLGLSISPVLPALIQAHGHAQIFGWLGLFIMGVSLHFLPRLSGVPLVRAGWIHAPAWMVATAVALRLVAQPAMSLGDPAWGSPALALAGVAQAAGVLVYVALIAASLRGHRIDAVSHPTIGSLRPLLFTALCGWLTSGGLMAFGLLTAAVDGHALVHIELHRLAVDTFVIAVLLPVAFAFARQLLPLYLQIEPSRTPLVPFALVYAVLAFVELACRAADLTTEAAVWPVAARLAAAARGAVILWFIVGLRLHRRRQALGQARPGRDGPTRYGRFSPSIYAAFGLLAAAAAGLCIDALCALAGADLGLHAAGLRHAFVAGFGTLLLLGVAPRMIPGFLGARGPAFPRWVLPPLFLAGPAAIGVSLGLLLPASRTPEWARLLFAGSGTLAWGAVALLAVNLWATWHAGPRRPARHSD